MLPLPRSVEVRPDAVSTPVLSIGFPLAMVITSALTWLGELGGLFDRTNLLNGHQVDFIYGTIRLIRKDEDAFLAWARDDFACVIFNLHVDHHGGKRARYRGGSQNDLTKQIERAGRRTRSDRGGARA